MRRSVAIAFCGVLLLSSVVWAGVLDTSKVSAKAKWVVHLDIKGLLASELGQHILDEIEARGHAEKIAEFAEKVGFDPTKDLRGVTLWGETCEADGGVAVIQGDIDKEKLLALAAENEEHKEAEYGEYVLQHWVQKPENRHDDGVRWGTFWANDVLLITRDRKVLENAIDTLNNEAATMAGQAVASFDVEASEGAFLMMAAKDFQVPAKRGHKAAMLRKLAGGFLELGEVDGTMFLNVSVTALEEADGEEFMRSLQGMLAFAKMSLRRCEETEQAPPHWAPFVQAVTIDGEGATVRLNVEMATADVVEMLEAAEEAKKAEAKCKP